MSLFSSTTLKMKRINVHLSCLNKNNSKINSYLRHYKRNVKCANNGMERTLSTNSTADLERVAVQIVHSLFQNEKRERNTYICSVMKIENP